MTAPPPLHATEALRKSYRFFLLDYLSMTSLPPT